MILFLLILISALVLNAFLPWWSIAIPGLLFGFIIKRKPAAAFGWGFLALFLLWGGHALYIHIGNDGILTQRIADMLSVGSPAVVILATGVIGGLVSGFATLTGALLSDLSEKKD